MLLTRCIAPGAYTITSQLVKCFNDLIPSTSFMKSDNRMCCPMRVRDVLHVFLKILLSLGFPLANYTRSQHLPVHVYVDSRALETGLVFFCPNSHLLKNNNGTFAVYSLQHLCLIQKYCCFIHNLSYLINFPARKTMLN